MPKIMQPGMREQPGLGALTAAQVLLRFSHAGRIHSEATFAMLLSTAPVPASSGRHRLAPAGADPAPPHPLRRPPAQPSATDHGSEKDPRPHLHAGVRAAP